MENLYPKHGLLSRTYSKKSLIMASIVGFKSKFSMIMSPFILSARLTAPPATNFAIRMPTNLRKLSGTLPSTTMKAGPNPQPQALDTTFEARVRDYMAAHTEGMERFENTIFKQREEINGRMTEMFGILKELTTSRTPEKVLIREEAKFPVTKNLNYISLTKEKGGGSNRTNVTPGDAKTETKTPIMEVEKINEVENRPNQSKHLRTKKQWKHPVLSLSHIT
ncbi:hypothetical protein Tco_0752241 [Tanacetum coccineum]|uniref:Uncharacterized protein n=1 Tax=Tanacetum coccineum TaxID=301880 RepID=A0ABQ4Z798_9ASTR